MASSGGARHLARIHGTEEDKVNCRPHPEIAMGIPAEHMLLAIFSFIAATQQAIRWSGPQPLFLPSRAPSAPPLAPPSCRSTSTRDRRELCDCFANISAAKTRANAQRNTYVRAAKKCRSICNPKTGTGSTLLDYCNEQRGAGARKDVDRSPRYCFSAF